MFPGLPSGHPLTYILRNAIFFHSGEGILVKLSILFAIVKLLKIRGQRSVHFEADG